MMLESSLAPKLWHGIETIKPQECVIFSYMPAVDSPLTDSCMWVAALLCRWKASIDRPSFRWSFNYFFFNKELKRVLFFTCSCSRSACHCCVKPVNFSVSQSYPYNYSSLTTPLMISCIWHCLISRCGRAMQGASDASDDASMGYGCTTNPCICELLTIWYQQVIRWRKWSTNGFWHGGHVNKNE